MQKQPKTRTVVIALLLIATVFTLSLRPVAAQQARAAGPSPAAPKAVSELGSLPDLTPGASRTRAPHIIPIGSSLTFGGTNVPDTYSAATTFSSTPVLVDNGKLKIWQEQVPTGATGEWDVFYMQTTNGGPLAANLNANWSIVIDFVLSAPVYFDAAVNQWTVSGTPVSPLYTFSAVCCAAASNPILPGEAFYNSGFSLPYPAGTQANWTEIYVNPYNYVSSGGINPTTANGFAFAYHFTLQPYNITKFQVSKTGSTFPTAINNQGNVVGVHSYTTKAGTPVTEGFERSTDGQIVKIVPSADNANFARANGINDNGLITGDYLVTSGGQSTYFGYLDQSGVITPYQVNGASTNVYGCNNAGSFTGAGFVNIGGQVTKIKYPGAQSTYPESINNTNAIAGQYTRVSKTSKNPVTHGFLMSGPQASPTSFDYPGAAQTFPVGINDSGEVSGYYKNSAGTTHGFFYSGGQFRDFTIRNATATFVTGMNNLGQLTGQYQTTTGQVYGFIATPAGSN